MVEPDSRDLLVLSLRPHGFGAHLPPRPERSLLLSGTRLRQALSEGAEIPAEFSRPEVLQVLREYYAAVQETVKTASEDKAPGPRLIKSARTCQQLSS